MEILKYEESEIRTVESRDSELWVAGIDVWQILEYKNERQAIGKLPDSVKKLEYIFDTSGQKRKAWIINEAGINLLVLRSKMPKAEPFQLWVTSEVLPSIRRTGSFLSSEMNYRETRLQNVSADLDKLNEEYNKSKTETADLKKKVDAKQVELHMEVKRDFSQIRIPGT